MNVTRALVAAGLAAVLAGCSSNDGLEDLREFVKNEHAGRKPKIEQLPEIKPMEAFLYTAADLPDPFSPRNLKAQVAAGASKGPAPDMNRRKEPLEDFPLDALKMVGTLARGKRFWAVVQAPDGTVHRLEIGNHLGQNFGRVTKITEEKVDLVELIQGALGEWVEREASLAIAE
jgi:type IV pilus assembly protein PilP